MRTFNFILATGAVIFTVSSSNAQGFIKTQITTDITKDQSETSVAISPLNSYTFLAGWNEIPKFGFGFSFNEGNTWIHDSIPDHHFMTNFTDPSVAFDQNGNAFFCYTANGLHYVWITKTSNYQPPYSWSHTLVKKDTSASLYTATLSRSH